MKVKRKSYRAVTKNKKFYIRRKRTIIQNEALPSTSGNSTLIDVIGNDQKLKHDNFINYAVQEMDYIENYNNDFEIPWERNFSNMAIDENQINDWENSKSLNNDTGTLQIEDGLLLPNFNIVLSKNVIKQLKKFDKKCGNIPWNTCLNCGRSFPNLILNNDKCKYCSKNSNKWTKHNNMDPGDVPNELSCLTDIEAMVIAQVHPIISVHRHKGGQHLYHGNIIFHKILIIL